MKMRMNIFSCLLALILGCNVTAAINHEVSEEKNQVALRCLHSVEGEVTWSREINGNKINLLTVEGDGQKRHIDDPSKRYSSLADKSLHIRRVTVSDSGRYFCNNEPAVELTVIPPGTTRLSAAVTTAVSLKCPSEVTGSHVPTWTRLNSGTNITIFSPNKTEEHASHRFRLQYSTEEKTLTITDVQPEDVGLYYCDGKTAAYLNVSKDEQNERAAVLVLGVLLPLLLLLIIIVIILFLTWRCRIKRRGRGGQSVEVVYAQLMDGLPFEPTQVTSQSNETLYSLINTPRLHGKNEENPQDQIKNISSSPPPANWTSIQ